jgi:hypothetical protein
MIRKIIIILSLFITLYALNEWRVCTDFTSPIHFSSLDMKLKLEEAIRNDVGYEPVVARTYHNKLNFGAMVILNSYLRFWDIRQGVLLFSIIGYLGIFLGFWYLIVSKNKIKWPLFAVLLLIPFIEVFHFPIAYHIRLGLLTVPYMIFSVFGLWNFLERDKLLRVGLLIILAILSFWFLDVFKSEIFSYCFIPEIGK